MVTSWKKTEVSRNWNFSNIWTFEICSKTTMTSQMFSSDCWGVQLQHDISEKYSQTYVVFVEDWILPCSVILAWKKCYLRCLIKSFLIKQWKTLWIDPKKQLRSWHFNCKFTKLSAKIISLTMIPCIIGFDLSLKS